MGRVVIVPKWAAGLILNILALIAFLILLVLSYIYAGLLFLFEKEVSDGR